MPILKLTKQKLQTIKELLEKKPHYRDNDRKLLAHIWYTEADKAGILSKDVKKFLEFYADGRLSNAETIRRHRQLLQEKHPELRGALHEEKHRHANEVADEVKNR